MGQYYRTFLRRINEDGVADTHVFNRTVDGERTMAKLMEHSWWFNPYVNAIAEKLYKDPAQIAWVGDYMDDERWIKEFFDKLYPDGEKPEKFAEEEFTKEVKDIYHLTWDSDGEGCQSTEFTMDGKYLVNHSQKIYLNCDTYKEKNEENGWIIHPLPLLTAIGNGLGGGDYFGTDEDSAGMWYLDLISIEDEIPEDYEEVEYFFAEKEL